jgi:hypothetical protein
MAHFFLYLLKNKIIYNFVNDICGYKKGRKTNFSPSFVVVGIQHPGSKSLIRQTGLKVVGNEK